MMESETKKRVPLAYVGYCNREDWRTRLMEGHGRTNADFVENYPPGLLTISISAERVDADVLRVVVRWQPLPGRGLNCVDETTGEVVKHIPNEVLYGGTVDVSDWGLQPLYEEESA